MNVDSAIKLLKEYIVSQYNNSKNSIRENISRGHLRSLSTDIEDGIAGFLLDILPEGYLAYVDVSVQIDNKKHRPDILIVDAENNVRAFIEVKANMGYCRDATKELNKILLKHKEMSSKGKITCTLSSKVKNTVNYSQEVEVFLVSFTSSNCSEKKHENNRRTSECKKIKYYCLFSGWYSENLENLDIMEFANKIRAIK